MIKQRWSIRGFLFLLELAVALPLIALLLYTFVSQAQGDTRRAQESALSLA